MGSRVGFGEGRLGGKKRVVLSFGKIMHCGRNIDIASFSKPSIVTAKLLRNITNKW